MQPGERPCAELLPGLRMCCGRPPGGSYSAERSAAGVEGRRAVTEVGILRGEFKQALRNHLAAAADRRVEFSSAGLDSSGGWASEKMSRAATCLCASH
jgi:hypothetical protein